jgi:hypothetical protein
MTGMPRISEDRRRAVGRAGRAVVRLAAHPEAKATAHLHSVTVNDVEHVDDATAWAAVDRLEDMVRQHSTGQRGS